MHPYTDHENKWLSARAVETSGTHLDILAIEAAARAMRSRLIGDAVVAAGRFLAARVKARVKSLSAPSLSKAAGGTLPRAQA